MGWLPIWGPSIAAVIVAAAFTWLFGVVNERQRRRGIRALVTHEIGHNFGNLLSVRGDLETVINSKKPRLGLEAFVASGKTPQWHHSRWDLPEVGVAFKVEELEDLAVWYWALYDLASHYQAQVSYFQTVKPSELSDSALEVCIQSLGLLLKMTNNLIETGPPVPKVWADTKDIRPAL